MTTDEYRGRIGAAETLRRESYGESLEGEACCAYCLMPQHDPDMIADVDDSEEWERIAVYHASDCRWVATRAHRI